MPLLPPFTPRPPLSKSKSKSLFRQRRFLTMAQNRTPPSPTNTACARLRLRRKYMAQTKRQTTLFSQLGHRLETLSTALLALEEIHLTQLLYLYTQTSPLFANPHLHILSHPFIPEPNFHGHDFERQTGSFFPKKGFDAPSSDAI